MLDIYKRLRNPFSEHSSSFAEGIFHAMMDDEWKSMCESTRQMNVLLATLEPGSGGRSSVAGCP